MPQNGRTGDIMSTLSETGPSPQPEEREENGSCSAYPQTAYVTWAPFTDGDRASAVLDSSGKGADALVARAAFAVRAPGSVGLTGADDRWWVVRVDSIQLSTPPWDDGLAGRVRTAIVWEREQAHLDSLAEQLNPAGQSALTSSGLRPATPDGTSRKSRRCC